MEPQLMVENALKVARSTGAVVFPVQRAFLRLQGRDSIEFLHRISTNDLLSMGVGEARSTIVCNEKGRVIDLVEVLHEGDSLLLALSAPEPDNTQRWIDKYIISEDIQVSAISYRMIEAWTLGPQAKTLGELIEQMVLETGIDSTVRESGRATTLWATNVAGVTVWRILWDPLPQVSTAYFEESVFQSIGVPVLAADAFDVWRICSGLPAWGKEFPSAYTPVEIGLGALVSVTKGCYIGQEVISRIEAYRKVVRKPVGISAVGAGEFSEGDLLLIDGKESGTITSAAGIRVDGRQFGIAITTADPGVHQSALLRDNDGNEMRVRLHSFPIIL